MASYLAVEDLESSERRAMNSREASLVSEATTSATIFLLRDGNSLSSWSASQVFTWETLLGFSSPVSATALAVSSSLERWSIATANWAIFRSMRTPRSLIRASRHQKRRSSGDGIQCSRVWKMVRSVSTSRLQYAWKVYHFSGACSGRFQVRPPFVLEGLQG